MACEEANAPLPSLSLSGQVNNATARVMTNKKTGNPYTNGRRLRAPGRLQGQGRGPRTCCGPAS